MMSSLTVVQNLWRTQTVAPFLINFAVYKDLPARLSTLSQKYFSRKNHKKQKHAQHPENKQNAHIRKITDNPAINL
ncbi:MAG: hypothetical protein C0514_07975 [Candidatus Puniceispirillum sp.]|nr:hypothetical protein [Candidatus Puniceispirillum sp.]